MKTRKIELATLTGFIKDTYDLFICSSSFENRCLSIAEKIKIENVKNALIVSNKDLKKFVGENKNKLTALFGKKGKVVDVCTSDPLFTADSLRKSISDLVDGKTGCSILLDMTTFTHESLLILLQLLKLNCPTANIKGVYANASQYSLRDEVRFKWLSRGIGEVRSVLGFPGNVSPSRKTHLIMIVGYEHERSAGIIEKIEPNSISLGYGHPGSATTDKDKDANERYMNLVREMATSFEVNTFEVPCDDPYGTFKQLCDKISQIKDMNVILAPMNNKLSTIGSAWAAFNNDDVQICYAQALRYNYLNYSEPGNHCYIVDFPRFFDRSHLH